MRLQGYLLAGVPAILALILCLLLINPFLSDYGDNALYLILAKSLATGQGFAVISEPGNPFDKLNSYGYPLFLALQMLALGRDRELATMVYSLKFSSTILFAGSVLLTYHLAAKRQPRSVALLCSFLTAMSPLALRFSTDLMSEIPFLFFSLAAIALVERAEQDHPPPWKDLLAAIALAIAFYIRTIGGVLVAAALIYVIIKSGMRRSLAMGTLLLILSIPWIQQQTMPETGPTYLIQLGDSVSQPDHMESVVDTLPGRSLLKRMAQNLKGYVLYDIPGLLFPHLFVLPNSSSFPTQRMLELLILALVTAGWIVRVRAGPHLAEIYIPASVVALSAWWQIDRFLVPLLPFLTLYLAVGIQLLSVTVADVVKSPAAAAFPKSHLLGMIIAAPIILSSIVQDYYAIRLNLAKASAGSESEYFAKTKPDYANYFRAAEWLRMNSPSDSTVMSLKPYLMYVYSGRRTIRSPSIASAEDVLRLIDLYRVDYVVEDSFEWSNSTSRVIAPAIRAYQDRFELVYSTPEPVTRLWHYNASSK